MTDQTITGACFGVTTTVRGRVFVTANTGWLYAGDVNGLDASYPIATAALNIGATPDGAVLLITHNNSANGLSVRSAADGSDAGSSGGPPLVGLAVGATAAWAGTVNGEVLALPYGGTVTLIPVGSSVVNGLVLDAPRNRVYATTTVGNVAMIDALTNSVVPDGGWTVSSQAFQQPVVSPDGQTLYIANETTGVERWNIATKTRTGLVPGTSGAFGLALTPDGVQLWATRSQQGTLELIDVATFTVARSITALGTVRRIAFDPTGQVGIVACETHGVHFVR